MAFYTDPELVDEIMRISVEYNTRLARNAKELGGEIIVTGDDIADNSGLLLSPEMYRAQVYPHYKQLVQNFKELGFLVIKHTDGNIMDVIDDLVATGIDCLDPIDPLAGMDIKQIKQQYGDSICIKGNVDCVETLVNKTEQDVIKATKKCILDASVGGGHIISSSNSIHASIDPQLYRTFLQTRKQYGQYPLDVETLSREVYDEK
jgi:uroporphyrinogen decarboxylase